ncbi:hypothetical protein EON63_19555 [archaeon]|nr:MAG: hypothetical protein EON63_19555 [archaeon]
MVSRGGNCLIPVFALGRAQELLLILDEYWIQNHDLQDIPIYYASRLANKSLKVCLVLYTIRHYTSYSIHHTSYIIYHIPYTIYHTIGVPDVHEHDERARDLAG